VHDRVKEEPTVGSLHGEGVGRHCGHGMAAREGRRSAGSVKEEGRKGKGGTRPGGLDRSAGPDRRWARGKKKGNRNLFRN
jgi:hypothetical protein